VGAGGVQAPERDDSESGKRAHADSWWGAQPFWKEENRHGRGYIYTA
jgi:hypothetical protein